MARGAIFRAAWLALLIAAAYGARRRGRNSNPPTCKGDEFFGKTNRKHVCARQQFEAALDSLRAEMEAQFNVALDSLRADFKTSIRPENNFKADSNAPGFAMTTPNELMLIVGGSHFELSDTRSNYLRSIGRVNREDFTDSVSLQADDICDDGDDEAEAWSVENAIGGGFKLSRTQQSCESANVTIEQVVLLQDGGLRKDLIITSHTAQTVNVTSAIFDHDEGQAVPLTAESTSNFDPLDISSNRFFDFQYNTTQKVGLSNWDGISSNFIFVMADDEAFGHEGSYQTIAGASNKAHLMQWNNGREEIRASWHDVVFEAGETKAISTFAVWDKTTSLVFLLERGFAVWDTLESVQENFPNLAVDMPANLYNW